MTTKILREGLDISFSNKLHHHAAPPIISAMGSRDS